jgi:hypothetical protein
MAMPDRNDLAPHLMVVIVHQEARVYRTEVHGPVPERIVPYDPHGYGDAFRRAAGEANGT